MPNHIDVSNQLSTSKSKRYHIDNYTPFTHALQTLISRYSDLKKIKKEQITLFSCIYLPIK